MIWYVNLPVCLVLLCCIMSSDVGWHIRDKLIPMPKHTLRPQKPDSSLGRTAQDGHLDSHSSWSMSAYNPAVPVHLDAFFPANHLLTHLV